MVTSLFSLSLGFVCIIIFYYFFSWISLYSALRYDLFHLARTQLYGNQLELCRLNFNWPSKWDYQLTCSKKAPGVIKFKSIIPIYFFNFYNFNYRLNEDIDLRQGTWTS